MPTVTRKAIIASIVQKTGVGPSKAKEALETVLNEIKRALGEGRQVDLGKLGRLSVVTRSPKNRACKNLKHIGPTIARLYRKHPKTVHLTKRHDLSPEPLPTIVHKREPAIKRSIAIALPSWRRRPR
jgi:nucleoid DNA-binding protein